ncbi:MAG: ABC transporter ATP-binding protein [Planctomycetota bacterium]
MSGAPSPGATDVLVVDDIAKTYRRGAAAYGCLREFLAAPLRATGSHGRVVHALDGVSLHVPSGGTFAVIGANGAGKSTLLKVVARITPPDRGRVFVAGRLSALIEVGAGFHPELTGRENVLLHGSILGLPRRVLRASMDEISGFAGLEDAMDTPVKFFSTGMYARLGFAVAVHAAPRVLLVDEVLSVGDEAFRERCYERIALLKRGGTGILFVSHDLRAVRRLAETTAWLEHGRFRLVGDSRDVVDAYRAWVASSPA